MARWEQAPVVAEPVRPQGAIAPVTAVQPRWASAPAVGKPVSPQPATAQPRWASAPPVDMPSRATEGQREPGWTAPLKAIPVGVAETAAGMVGGAGVYLPGKVGEAAIAAGDWIADLPPKEWQREVAEASSGPLFEWSQKTGKAWSTNIARQLPVWLSMAGGGMVGRPIGAAIGVAAAGALGQAGPQAATPEEVVTMPAGAGIGGTIGSLAGQIGTMSLVEADQFRRAGTALGLDPDLAIKYAQMYGPVSGAIEYVQGAWALGRPIMGGRAVSPALQKLGATVGGRVAKEITGVVWEGVEEWSQNGVSNYLLGKAVAEHNIRHPDTPLEAPALGEGGLRAFALGAGVGAVIRAGSKFAGERGAPPGAQPTTPPVPIAQQPAPKAPAPIPSEAGAFPDFAQREYAAMVASGVAPADALATMRKALESAKGSVPAAPAQDVMAGAVQTGPAMDLTRGTIDRGEAIPPGGPVQAGTALPIGQGKVNLPGEPMPGSLKERVATPNVAPATPKVAEAPAAPPRAAAGPARGPGQAEAPKAPAGVQAAPEAKPRLVNISVRSKPVQRVKPSGTWEAQLVADVNDLTKARLDQIAAASGGVMGSRQSGDVVELFGTHDTQTSAEGTTARWQALLESWRSEGKAPAIPPATQAPPQGAALASGPVSQPITGQAGETREAAATMPVVAQKPPLGEPQPALPTTGAPQRPEVATLAAMPLADFKRMYATLVARMQVFAGGKAVPEQGGTGLGAGTGKPDFYSTLTPTEQALFDAMESVRATRKRPNATNVLAALKAMGAEAAPEAIPAAPTVQTTQTPNLPPAQATGQAEGLPQAPEGAGQANLPTPPISVGMKGTYDFGGGNVLPVTITGKTTRTVQGRTVELWEGVDESSHRMFDMWAPENFKPSVGPEALSPARPPAAPARPAEAPAPAPRPAETLEGAARPAAVPIVRSRVLDEQYREFARDQEFDLENMSLADSRLLLDLAEGEANFDRRAFADWLRGQVAKESTREFLDSEVSAPQAPRKPPAAPPAAAEAPVSVPGQEVARAQPTGAATPAGGALEGPAGGGPAAPEPAPGAGKEVPTPRVLEVKQTLKGKKYVAKGKVQAPTPKPVEGPTAGEVSTAAPPAKPPEPPKATGKAELKALGDSIKRDMTNPQMTLGVPPFAAKLVRYGYLHFKAGLQKFIPWAARMVKDLGSGVSKFLRQTWERVLALHKNQTATMGDQPETPEGFLGKKPGAGGEPWADAALAKLEAKPAAEQGKGAPQAVMPQGALDWTQAETGVPIMLNGYRGEGGYGGLTAEQQAKFEREFLLGEGSYIAPTARLAAAFGSVKKVHLILKNPYVIESTNQGGLRELDIANIKSQGYDGIVVKSGRAGFGRGQEDLKQAVAFTSAAQEGHRGPDPNRITVGSVVSIGNLAGNADYIQTYRADALAAQGKTGTVVRFGVGDHPTVRIEGKNIDFNASEVALATPSGARGTTTRLSATVRKVSRPKFPPIGKDEILSAPPAKPPEPPKATGKAELKALGDSIKRDMTNPQMTLGVPPFAAKLVRYGYLHFKAGLQKFIPWAARMVKDLGSGVSKFLRQTWERVLALHKNQTATMGDQPETPEGFLGKKPGAGGESDVQRRFLEAIDKSRRELGLPERAVERAREETEGQAKPEIREVVLSVKARGLNAAVRKNLTPQGTEAQAIMDGQDRALHDTLKTKTKTVLQLARKNLWDVAGNVKATLERAGGQAAKEVLIRHDLVYGASGRAQERVAELATKVWADLSRDEMALFNHYAEARRTVERYAIGNIRQAQRAESGAIPGFEDAIIERPEIVSPLSEAQAEAYIRDAEATPGFEKVRAAFETYTQEFGAQNVRRLHENGLLSDAGAQTLLTLHKNYHPFLFLQYLDPSRRQTIGGKTIDVTDSGISRLEHGSESDLVTDTPYLAAQSIARVENRIAKNAANRALAEFAKTDAGKQLGLAVPDPVGKTGEALNYGEAPHGYADIYFYENGNRRPIRVPEAWAEEWVTYSPEITSSAAQWLRRLSGADIVRLLATGINPAFALTNTPVDVGTVWFSSEWLGKFIGKPLYSRHLPVFLVQIARDMLKVLPDVVRRTGRFRDAIEDGMAMNFLTMQGQGPPKPIAHWTRGDTALAQFRATWQNAKHYLGWLGETSEVATRLALRERALRQGATREQATWVARAYLDFSQGGSFVKMMDNVLPYLNAAVQGTRSMAKAGYVNPAAFAYRVAQLGSVAAGLAALSILFSRDMWNSISDDLKDRYFIIPIPPSFGNWVDENGNKRAHYLTIAKPGVIRPFASAFEAIMEAALTGRIPTRRLYSGSSEIFSVVPIGKWPPTMAAFLAYAGNFDTWQLADVWKGPKVEPKEEINPNTHPFFVELGQQTGLSPVRLQAGLSTLVPPYNPAIAATAFATRAVLDPDSAKNAGTMWQEAANASGLGRIWRSTPARPPDIEGQRLTIAENTRRHAQNRELQRLSANQSVAQIVRDYIMKQPPVDRKRLFERIKLQAMLKGVDSWYLDLRDMAPEVAALAYLRRWTEASSDDQKKMDAMLRRVPGIVSPRFLAARHRFLGIFQRAGELPTAAVTPS